MKNWYIVQTFSGFENKVAEVLKDKNQFIKFRKGNEYDIYPDW